MPLTNTEVDAAVPFGAGEQPDRALTNAALKELIVDIAAKAITVQDEGVSLATSADTLNFVGAGVSATGTGATKTITIAGGGDVATDAIWDAAGDLAVGSGANTAARLPIGAEGTFLGVVGGSLAYSTPAGSGDVTKVGTPLNNQMPVWTGDGTLEGTSDFTYDGTSLNLVTGKNFQIAGGTVLSDAAGTLTLSGIDALDPTTEATVEAAIDTLANLTSVQGRTVTLADAGADAVFGWDDSASAYQNLSAADARSALELTALATTTPGANVATFLTTPSSANLRAAITDEDGDGALLFANAPATLSGATNLVRATHGNRYLVCDTAATHTVEDDTAGGWQEGDVIYGDNTSAGNVVLVADSTGTTNTVTAETGHTLTVAAGRSFSLRRTGANAWVGGALTTGGDVTKVGTPVNNQVGIWTGDGTLEGDAALTFDTTTDALLVGAGSITRAGAHLATITTTDTTGVTLPTSGTLATLDGTESLSNKTLVAPALGTPASGVLTNCTGLPVAGGGTGVASLTAYAPIFGGTTGTGAVQSGTVGTLGQVLTSNGAGALATFQDAGAASVLPIQQEWLFQISGGATAWSSAYGMASIQGTVAAVTTPFDTSYGAPRGRMTATDAVVNSGVATARGVIAVGGVVTGGYMPGSVDSQRIIYEGLFAPTDTATGRRWAVGLYLNNASNPSASADPDAWTNVAIFAKRAADSNIQFITNSATSTGTATDLGANFPAAASDAIYFVRVTARGGGTPTIDYYIKHLKTGNSATGSITADIPVAASELTGIMWASNGPTTATAATFDASYQRIKLQYQGL